MTPPDPKHRLLVTGAIFTADPDQPWAEALVVEGSEISFVGTVAAATAHVGFEAVELIDAGDGVVIPGFVDAHAHMLHTGAALVRAQLRQATSLDEIAAELRRWVAANPDEPRVLGVGWIFSAVPGSMPTRQMLDEIIADRPAYLDASDLHSVWVNSAALAELGITDGENCTPDPVGGHIVRDKDGTATGLLLENAGYHIAWPVMNQATDTVRDIQLRTAVDAYIAAGTTAAVDMGLDQDSLDALLGAEARGELAFTVIGHWLINRTGDPATELAQVSKAAELVARHGATADPEGKRRVKLVGIKLITDGTIDGCTAGMCHSFTNGEPGEMVWPREAMEPVVLAADAAGMQIALHAIGDLAVRTCLDVLEVAARRREERGDIRERRHRIEHLEYVDEADVPRLAPLGVTASMQPVHVDPAYLDNWIELLGHDRAQRGFAWPEYVTHGATLAFGTDTPTAAHHPLPNMYLAATRCSPYDHAAVPLRPDFALPLDQSVVHATRDAAWASFEEGRRGMLSPGLAADLVVLDCNPFRDGAQTLLTTRVVRTVVGGQTVFRA